MKNKNDIQKEIEKTLSVLDRVGKTDTDAFFYTRLSAKMENSKNRLSLEWIFNLPLLKPLIVAFILFINIISISHFLNSGNVKLTNEEIIDLFNQEYFMTQASDSYLVINEDL